MKRQDICVAVQVGEEVKVVRTQTSELEPLREEVAEHETRLHAVAAEALPASSGMASTDSRDTTTSPDRS